MKEEIVKELASIEAANNVTIIWACESGSRAWGFESKDSDYDVRFIYFHDIDWYLSIEKQRDVIEKPIDKVLDINGWDIKKSLVLLKKSNPPLLEWLQSPIVYVEIERYSNLLKDLLPIYYSTQSCYYHYLHMANGNFRDYLRNDEVWIKKYFYVLRPILACKWIEKFNQPVPVQFDVLTDKLLDDKLLIRAVSKLIDSKKNGEELDYAPKIPEISNFIERELEVLNKKRPEKGASKGYGRLNEVFREIIMHNASDSNS